MVGSFGPGGAPRRDIKVTKADVDKAARKQKADEVATTIAAGCLTLLIIIAAGVAAVVLMFCSGWVILTVASAFGWVDGWTWAQQFAVGAGLALFGFVMRGMVRR